MNVIILGLKEKKTGAYVVYDVTGNKKHIPIALNETKKIEVLAPFPFSNFSSLDTFDESRFEKCYLEVEGDVYETEFRSMKSSGIVYHRFFNRQVTLLSEFHDIFQYSLKMLRVFGKNLGTYDLTTWVMHNETKNEAEYKAMKQIITEAVCKKENKQYPLDISLDQFTLVYMDTFRELVAKGYHITFGRYGSNDRALFKKETIPLSNETFLYVLKNVRLYDYSFLDHPMFTPAFYDEFVKGTPFEEELFYDMESKDITALINKGFDIDELYQNIFGSTVNKFNHEFPEYNGDFFQIFSDSDFVPYTKHVSPYDYYCCEDCDGYDIHELYSEEELAGEDVLVDERLAYVQKLIGHWGDFLTPKCYPLFDKIPSDVLAQFSTNHFFTALLAFRKTNQD